ncbi:MAG TPA: LacI family DNA-binding transcriptional regulator [Thermotogota bacterium]|nr:LacI family DNA-binding transcriptional regulator [Thermotogota bacterium]HPJ88741.1 LacI family DNA-binding transcriptional regulator [Thermotogota bacterium]HPR97547.1 LacI family DNA-binding transcriptional regulator [Thermotogota bacterium]
MSNISDIAKLAGVSTGTVSKVLNNDERVKDKNREKVLEAMNQLNYKPNLHARNLSKGKTGLISIIIPTIGHEFMARIVNAIDATLEKNDYDSVLFPMLSQSRLKRFSDPFHFLYHTDGLIISSLSLKSLFGKTSIPVEKPVVVLDTYERDYDCVYVDNYIGGQLAAEHLNTRDRIFMIGGLESDSAFTSNAFSCRKEGFIKTIHEKYGSQTGIDEIPITLDWNKSFELGKRLAEENDSFSVFCLSDILARGFMEGAAKSGKEAGKDYSLIGFDNLEFAENLAISTIAQPVEQLGIKGAEIILGKIAGKQQKSINEKVIPEYIERGSNK